MSTDFRLYLVTWNVGESDPPQDLSSLLGLNEKELPDLYAIGLQELKSDTTTLITDSIFDDPWTNSITGALSQRGYVRIKSLRLVGIHLSVYIKRTHLFKISGVESDFTRTGFGGIWGSKGGISIKFNIHGVNLCLVNSHFSAHDENFTQRIEDYNYVLLTQKFKEIDCSNILDNDYVFWLGDLNFRLDDFSNDMVRQRIIEGNYHGLLCSDQLNNARKERLIFLNFEEGPILFPPTYKFDVNSDQYDTSQKSRKPAWCDRILWRVHDDGFKDITLEVDQNGYTSLPGYRNSDHKPVVASFTIKVLKDAPVLPVMFEPLSSWARGKDQRVVYTISKKFLSSSRDWIGLYPVNFKNFEDYATYIWVPSKGEDNQDDTFLHTAVFEERDLSRLKSGNYQLLYFSAVRNYVVGYSDVVEILDFDRATSSEDESVDKPGEANVDLPSGARHFTPDILPPQPKTAVLINTPVLPAVVHPALDKEIENDSYVLSEKVHADVISSVTPDTIASIILEHGYCKKEEKLESELGESNMNVSNKIPAMSSLVESEKTIPMMKPGVPFDEEDKLSAEVNQKECSELEKQDDAQAEYLLASGEPIICEEEASRNEQVKDGHHRIEDEVAEPSLEANQNEAKGVAKKIENDLKLQDSDGAAETIYETVESGQFENQTESLEPLTQKKVENLECHAEHLDKDEDNQNDVRIGEPGEISIDNINYGMLVQSPKQLGPLDKSHVEEHSTALAEGLVGNEEKLHDVEDDSVKMDAIPELSSCRGVAEDESNLGLVQIEEKQYKKENTSDNSGDTKEEQHHQVIQNVSEELNGLEASGHQQLSKLHRGEDQQLPSQKNEREDVKDDLSFDVIKKSSIASTFNEGGSFDVAHSSPENPNLEATKKDDEDSGSMTQSSSSDFEIVRPPTRHSTLESFEDSYLSIREGALAEKENVEKVDLQLTLSSGQGEKDSEMITSVNEQLLEQNISNLMESLDGMEEGSSFADVAKVKAEQVTKSSAVDDKSDDQTKAEEECIAVKEGVVYEPDLSLEKSDSVNKVLTGSEKNSDVQNTVRPNELGTEQVEKFVNDVVATAVKEAVTSCADITENVPCRENLSCPDEKVMEEKQAREAVLVAGEGEGVEPIKESQTTAMMHHACLENVIPGDQQDSLTSLPETQLQGNASGNQVGHESDTHLTEQQHTKCDEDLTESSESCGIQTMKVETSFHQSPNTLEHIERNDDDDDATDIPLELSGAQPAEDLEQISKNKDGSSNFFDAYMNLRDKALADKSVEDSRAKGEATSTKDLDLSGSVKQELLDTLEGDLMEKNLSDLSEEMGLKEAKEKEKKVVEVDGSYVPKSEFQLLDDDSNKESPLHGESQVGLKEVISDLQLSDSGKDLVQSFEPQKPQETIFETTVDPSQEKTELYQKKPAGVKEEILEPIDK